MKVGQVIEELQGEVAQLRREMLDFWKWKNSSDWNKDLIKRLEYLIKDTDKQLQCFHDWQYMHMHKDMAVFYCERCGGIQRRKWQDLTGKEIEGLELLGIHEPEQKKGSEAL